jgi:uncharacterized protein
VVRHLLARRPAGATLYAALARAEGLGGGRALDPISLPGTGRMAVFTDPDGNPVGLLGP